MKKRPKIKRYGNIYGRGARTGSLLMVVAMVMGLGLLAVVGWSLYTPIHDMIMGLGQEPRPSSDAPLPSAAPIPGEEPPPDAPPAVLPNPAGTQKEFRGLYAPPSAVADFSVLDGLIAAAKEAGLTAIMVDAKDATGSVLYRTEAARAVSARAVAENAYDAAAVAKRIADAGLTPVARIHAFRDNLMGRFDRDVAVGYYDTRTNWLDNSVALGGKAWLNPYSDGARTYIIDLAAELTALGFEQIVVDSVQFPSGVALDKAGYGPQAVGVGRADALKSFSQELEKAVAAAGGSMMLYYPANGVVGENPMIYGGNAASLASEITVLGILPTSLPDDLSLGGTVVARPGDDYAATVTAVLEYAATVTPENARLIAMLQAYGADGALLPAGDLTRQAEAARAAGAAGYLFYNPQGNYRLD